MLMMAKVDDNSGDFNEKTKIFIPIFIIIIGISIVLADTYNTTIEDLIYEQASTDNTSPVHSKIAEIEDDGIILYLYETEDMRLGYATVKINDSIFNKYSLCSVENVDISLIKEKEIIHNYTEQGLNFNYGIIANPSEKYYQYEGEKYELNIFDFNNITIGVFIYNKND